MEPFIVVGGMNDNDGPTAKTGPSINDTVFQIDIYLSKEIGKVAAENIRFKAKNLIGKRRGVTSELLIDDSIGREVYHIPIRISELIY